MDEAEALKRLESAEPLNPMEQGVFSATFVKYLADHYDAEKAYEMAVMAVDDLRDVIALPPERFSNLAAEFKFRYGATLIKK